MQFSKYDFSSVLKKRGLWFGSFKNRGFNAQELERILAMVILSVCPSVCQSQPGTVSKPAEIETSGFHHMIA